MAAINLSLLSGSTNVQPMGGSRSSAAQWMAAVNKHLLLDQAEEVASGGSNAQLTVGTGAFDQAGGQASNTAR
jgi:hypothetical protein